MLNYDVLNFILTSFKQASHIYSNNFNIIVSIHVYMLNGLKPLLVSKGKATCSCTKHHKTHNHFIKNNKKFYTPCFIYYRQPLRLWVHDSSFFMWYNTSMSVLFSLCNACYARLCACLGVLFLKYKKFVESFFKYKKFVWVLKPHLLFSLGGDTPLKLRNSIKEMPLDIAKLSRRARMQHMHSISAYASHSNRCAGERHARNA